MNLAFELALGTMLFSCLALATTVLLRGSQKATQSRILQVTRPLALAASGEKMGDRFLPLVRTLRERVGLSEDPKLRENLAAAGIRSNQAIETFFAAQMLGPIAGILAGSFISRNTMFFIMVLVLLGYMVPGMVLKRMIKKRRERIRKAIPDCIDLLVICVDAGLGLDQAMLRSGQELAVSHPDINEEFLQINREQRAGKPRMEAWSSMARRTQLPDIDGFVNMLVQTERFGTPIARALSNFADLMRLKRRQAAEERAAKTTVKMLFPLVLFIFPCLFIVLLGPAVLSIMHGMSAMKK